MIERIETNDLLEKLVKVEPEGIGITIENRILNLRHEIFYRSKKIFINTNQLRYNFEPDESLSLNDFQEFYKNTNWTLEC